MSLSPSPADGVGDLCSRLPARSIKSQRTEDLARTNVIDLTVESDGDEISEIPLNEFVEATVLVKKERKEPAGLLDKISETDREAERDAFESIEAEGISTSAIARATPRVNPEATLSEATVAHNVTSTNISAEAIALENNSTVFIPPRPAAIQLSREELIARDKELDLMLRNGIITLRASQDQNGLSITPQQSNNRNHPSPHPPTPPYINDQDADAAAAANFQQLKQWYEARERRAVTTFSEDIEYEKACQAEENRIRLQKKKRTYAEQEAQETAHDERLFFSDIENAPTNGPSDFPTISSGSDSEAPTSKRAKINRPTKIPSSALEESMRIGFEAEKSRSKGSAKKQRKRKDSAKKASTDTVKKLKGKKDVQKARKKGRPRKGPEITNLASLLTHNLIADAQANQDRPGAPVFTSNRRKDALKELIASMPADQQKLYTADRTALDKACRSFSGVQSIKAKGSSGWVLRGMRSALQNYQLLGTCVASHGSSPMPHYRHVLIRNSRAFMRERENCGKRPFGGIQSDEMGLGKTVMMVRVSQPLVLSSQCLCC
jgi:SNF2 family DNA or RNA helicase